MSATRFTAHPAGSSDLDTVVRVSIMAFSDEAVIAWAIPNAVDRHAYMRDTFSSLLQSAVDAGAVILARDSGGTAVAASIWVPSRGSATADASARQTSGPRATEAYPDDPIKRRLEHVEAATRARTPPGGAHASVRNGDSAVEPRSGCRHGDGHGWIGPRSSPCGWSTAQAEVEIIFKSEGFRSSVWTPVGVRPGLSDAARMRRTAGQGVDA